ncbi:MAG: hypothetical protein LEGION0398_MBIBDBAK_00048 [Legionellaceae bacterium]
MDKNEPKKIIIEGVTEEGELFRPSDWAERMSGSLCTFRNRRITYSPLLQPIVKGGNKCVLVDPMLRETNPALYETIMAFARVNHLKVGSETNDDETT